MTYTKDYATTEPSRTDIDASEGITLLEFGAPGCGFCLAIQPALEKSLQDVSLSHVKVEDGSGRPLGRSFGVKLWPTLVFMRDGVEVARAVRPSGAEVRELVAQHGS
jgi:thioredoxin 1